jgi:ribA/ribD-fused uncharacterized protein
MIITPSNIANVGNSGAKDFGFKEFVYFLREPEFSQWGRFGFSINGIDYKSAEQWMMACKARLFKDTDTLAEILAADHPRDQKALGRKVKGFIKHEWDKVARECVKIGNMAKIEQNPEVKKAILDTKGCTLVEVNPNDGIWGIGLSRKEAEAGIEWRGTNWLGEVLTEIRMGLENGTN